MDGVAYVRNSMEIEATLDDDVVPIGRINNSHRTPSVGVQRHGDPFQRCAVTHDDACLSKNVAPRSQEKVKKIRINAEKLPRTH
ncbi:hypothetical protein [Intrasporangium mesophilum]